MLHKISVLIYATVALLLGGDWLEQSASGLARYLLIGYVIGALIVLSNENVPAQILESGTRLNSDISAELIEGIFIPKAPLHDGAMIVSGTKIVAAGCFLPISEAENIPKDLGTRHRAAIGITEMIDVTVLIVSEETGIISVVSAGKMKRYADTEMLKNTLKRFYWQDMGRI